LRDTSAADFIKSSAINGFYANKGFQEINQIASYVDSIDFGGSSMRNELVSNAINEKLRIYADTCSIPLVALYALYRSQFEKNYNVNQEYYNKFNKKWKKEKSAYFIEFRNKTSYKNDHNIVTYLLLSCSFFFIGFIVRSGYRKPKEIDKNIIKDLTNQERKILSMIKEGKSNKDISEGLSIGLSTVKSHVYSIYSKLDIKSRKEILNMNLENDY
jgi:DNA-binding CsgD family transcriptional regulator